MEVGTYEAKTQLPRLLARVAKGERVVITRHGKPVADIVPHVSSSLDAHRAAVNTLLGLRERLRAAGVRVSRAEVKEWVNEGRP